ncbi:MAG: hypothetical protein C5B50_15480 [Verrucomicrobia bacterium]|nr:MAG: hypothetical protein C5B50_15480 [Verrucomicrobiota bacterium]
MPDDLLREVRRAAKETGLSLADAMRQSMKLGLPKLTEQLSRKALKPMTPEECRQCWEVPNPEFDALEAAMARRPPPPPPEED